ncbi:MAG: LysE family transporter [Thermoplasmata archaeon]|nr:LysE family transporter [Thermoplasmata archaeon]
MNELYFVLAGLGLGFSLTVPPGPMNALIASRTMRSLRAGITTGLGAMSADAVLGAIVYIVRVSVDLGPWVRWIEGVGAVVLAGMAFRLLREHQSEDRRPTTELRVFSEALVVGVTNPFQILWWVTAGLAFAYVGGALLLAGLFAAIAVWVVVFPYVLSEGVRRDARVPRLVSLASALLLVAFAVYLALRAAGVML